MDIGKLFGGFSLDKLGKRLAHKDRIGKTDLGILKVAFMVAAIDGEVTDDEYALFGRLVKKCRGYSEKSAAAALDEAMRSAGYLLMLSRRVKEPELVKAFVAEASAALPDGFVYLSLAEIRQAVVTWIMMGMGDGNYSRREVKCIEALRRHFAEVRVSVSDEELERWNMLSPAYRQVCGVTPQENRKVELVSRDFVARVEKVVADLGDSAAARAEMKKLVACG